MFDAGGRRLTASEAVDGIRVPLPTPPPCSHIVYVPVIFWLPTVDVGKRGSSISAALPWVIPRKVEVPTWGEVLKRGNRGRYRLLGYWDRDWWRSIKTNPYPLRSVDSRC